MSLWSKTDSSYSMPKNIIGDIDQILFEDMNDVYSDGFPGISDPNVPKRLGWYFTNLVKGNKVNWYFFNGTRISCKLGETSYYTLITLDSIASRPFLVLYTKKRGQGDVGSWYRSRVATVIPNTAIVGTKYLIHVGSIPDSMFPGIPRIEAQSTGASVGPRSPDEEILTIAVGSDSSSNANTVKFICEAVGIVSNSYIKNLPLRIRSEYNERMDQGTSSEIIPEKASNVFLVDSTEAILAKDKGITGPGWWTYNTYTTSTGKIRHKAECLVPMKIIRSISGDRSVDDSILPNGIVSIDIQPSNIEGIEGESFVLSANASAQGLNVTYQWQQSIDGIEFMDIINATGSTYTGTFSLETNGYLYRVVASAPGFISTPSTIVSITSISE